VFSLYRLNKQRFSTLGLDSKFGFIKVSGLFRVRFRHASPYVDL